MSNSCILIEDVCKRFNNQDVLDHVSLNIPYAKIYGLLGPSGAGKTTLVRIIAGIDIADQGFIDVMDERMPRLDLMRNIGYMAQSDALYGDLTALQNLQFFAALYGLKGIKQKHRINEVMKLVDLLSDMNKRVHQYSGGMKRRLSLAIALLHEPQILVLDEPTVGIDPVLRQSIWKELKKICEHGTTILITTHVMDEAEKCDNLALLRNGRIIAYGTPSQLKTDTASNTIEEAFLSYGGAAL